MTKRVLIIDDSAYRQAFFLNLFGGLQNVYVHIALTLEDAKARILLSKLAPAYSLILLDHDLGIGREGKPEDTKELVPSLRAIASKVVVISMNPVGGDSLFRDLPGLLRCPFSRILENKSAREILLSYLR